MPWAPSFQYDGEDFWGCPFRGARAYSEPGTPPRQIKVEPWAQEVVALYPHYKAGILLVAGGLIDQPAFYVHCMRIVASEEGAIDAEQQEENRRSAKAAQARMEFTARRPRRR